MAVLISRNQVAQMIYESTLYLLALWEHQTDEELAALNAAETPSSDHSVVP